MPTQVWGTFSVNDHVRPNAFVREVLVFDRVVLPYPVDDVERDRWRLPDPAAPSETWDPDRLDSLLALMGTQTSVGYNGARAAWTAPWSEAKWRFERSRTEVAALVSNLDAYFQTRVILAMDEELPDLVEAVAAFPSEAAWRDEVKPLHEPPPALNAAQALVFFAWPLLTPGETEGTDFRPLREALDLARDDDYKEMRTAYHDWMRRLVAPLQQAGSLGDIRLDAGSLNIAREEFEHLVRKQQSIVSKDASRRKWRHVALVTTAVGAAASAGLALVNPLATLGVVVAAMQLGGYIATERGADAPQRSVLGGASLFPVAQRAIRGDDPSRWSTLLRRG
jgi:hypothetical protein